MATTAEPSVICCVERTMGMDVLVRYVQNDLLGGDVSLISDDFQKNFTPNIEEGVRTGRWHSKNPLRIFSNAFNQWFYFYRDGSGKYQITSTRP